MDYRFTQEADEQYAYWEAQDPKVHQRINDLIEDCLLHPFTGLGRPEPLRFGYARKWSRRITKEHRLVYGVDGSPPDQIITIYQCRWHY